MAIERRGTRKIPNLCDVISDWSLTHFHRPRPGFSCNLLPWEGRPKSFCNEPSSQICPQCRAARFWQPCHQHTGHLYLVIKTFLKSWSAVVYFNQQTGALHGVCWSKSYFCILTYFPVKIKKKDSINMQIMYLKYMLPHVNWDKPWSMKISW